MSEKYEVKMTAYALGQLKEIVHYISDVLMEPQTALNWLNRIESEQQSLSYMPYRIALATKWRLSIFSISASL